MSDIKELPIEEQLELYRKGEIDATEVDVNKIPIENPFDAFNDGCDLVLGTLEGFMDEMDQTDGMYEAKYNKVKRMIAGMRASVGNSKPVKEQSAIEVPSQQIILPN